MSNKKPYAKLVDEHRRLKACLSLTALMLFLSLGGNAWLLDHGTSTPERAGLVARTEPVSEWVARTVTQALSVSFQQSDLMIGEDRLAFGTQGWDDLRSTLASTGIDREVHEGQMLTSAVPMAVPVTLSHTLDHDVQRWHMQVPVIMTYESSSDRVTRQVTVDLNVSLGGGRYTVDSFSIVR